MQGVVFSRLDMHAWVPFESSLSQNDFIGVDLGIVAPLFETQSTTCRVSLVIGGSSHDLGSETHRWHPQEQRVSAHHRPLHQHLILTCEHSCSLQHLLIFLVRLIINYTLLR